MFIIFDKLEDANALNGRVEEYLNISDTCWTGYARDLFVFDGKYVFPVIESIMGALTNEEIKLIQFDLPEVEDEKSN